MNMFKKKAHLIFLYFCIAHHGPKQVSTNQLSGSPRRQSRTAAWRFKEPRITSIIQAAWFLAFLNTLFSKRVVCQLCVNHNANSNVSSHIFHFTAHMLEMLAISLKLLILGVSSVLSWCFSAFHVRV